MTAIVTTMAQSPLSEPGSKSAPTRNTKQKSAIREVFELAGRPLGPQEVLEMATPKIKGLGIATVYRSIKTLLEEGWLTAVDLPGAPSRYEVAGKDHHHHFHCNDCGKVFELHGCLINPKPHLPAGFTATSHEVVLYGFCDVCSAKPKHA